MTNSDKYLGLPMTCGKSRVNTFKELEEKIHKRVLGWKEKFISKAGREVLIKKVAQAIPTYAMSLFKLPKSMYDSINSLLAKYWWGQNKEERKIHWVNWKKLCTSKQKGGMGFRDLHAFNLAMLSKQAWRLTQDINSLFYKVYKARYFPNCSFMTAQLGSNSSFVWRSLLAARDIIFNGSKWWVEDGKTVGVYSHKWLSHPPIPLNEHAQDMKVSELLDVESRQWDRGKIETLFAPRTRQEILAIPLDHLNSPTC